MPRSPSTPLCFLDLPKEIRLMIYERLPRSTRHAQLVVQKWQAQQMRKDLSLTLVIRSISMSILGTCRLIHDEAKPIMQKIALEWIVEGGIRVITGTGYVFIDTLALFVVAAFERAYFLNGMVPPTSWLCNEDVTMIFDHSGNHDMLNNDDTLARIRKAATIRGRQEVVDLDRASRRDFYNSVILDTIETHGNDIISFVDKAARSVQTVIGSSTDGECIVQFVLRAKPDPIGRYPAGYTFVEDRGFCAIHKHVTKPYNEVKALQARSIGWIAADAPLDKLHVPQPRIPQPLPPLDRCPLSGAREGGMLLGQNTPLQAAEVFEPRVWEEEWLE